MADLNRTFLKMLEAFGASKLRFAEGHFEIRMRSRGLNKEMIETTLFDRAEELVDVLQTTNKGGEPRYKAYYKYSKKKSLLIVLDEEEGFLKVVTFIIMDKKQQLGAIRNATKYSKIARRL